jgi:prepilin-type N-terminal cleavage/methylation domain-containing protein
MALTPTTNPLGNLVTHHCVAVPPHRTLRGFTLLELILVLGLLGLLLGLAAPSLQNFMKSRRTADAAGQVLAMTHAASTRALAQGAICRLNIDPKDCVYWLTQQEAGTFVELSNDFGRRFSLPEGTSISLTIAADKTPRTYIEFYPSGRTETATIELVGSRGEVYQVMSDSPTEEFHVVSPNGGKES